MLPLKRRSHTLQSQRKSGREASTKPTTKPISGLQVEAEHGSSFNDAEDISRIEDRIGYVFSDKSLIERAITHSSLEKLSYANKGSGNYERLEFIGDAVFDLGVAYLLTEAYPSASEGELTKMRAALVSTSALADVGRNIELSQCVRVGKSQQETGGAFREALLADVLEAIVGAVFIEAGFDVALQVIQRLVATRLVYVSPKDPKTELQEQLHLLKRGAPEYCLEETKGPGHNPLFFSVVKIDGQEYGRGEGSSKKSSQQDAAEKALARLLREEKNYKQKA